MDIFSIFSLLGGLAFFLFGMSVMSKSLEKMAGGNLERLLKRMTTTRIKALLLGIGITVAIQSSSAVTVMLVGLVNSGVMTLSQSIGVIMGSNIGTTTTAWILSLAGIESDNLFVNLLKPENFSPLLALAGIILIMGSKKQRRRDIGRVMIGFAILMSGMEIMKEAVEPLAENPSFTQLLTSFSNPLLGVLVGTVFTAVIQSSSASVGILQVLALTGTVTHGAAIPIIMGQNIGTCVTALISSIGVNRNAKQVAVVHMSFNIIGTVIFMSLFYGINALFPFPLMNDPISSFGVAVFHSIFNIFTTLILLPFSSYLEALAQKLAPAKDTTADIAFLDPLLMRTPGVAVGECVHMTVEMGEIARSNVLLALQQLDDFQEQREAQILQNEDKLDIFEDRLGGYLVEISQHGTSMRDSRTISRLLHAISDFERVGDHALNLQDSARELHEKKLAFSPAAQAELAVLLRALEDILDRALQSFAASDPSTAQEVEPLEETVDYLIEEIRSRHIRRLQRGECTIQLGFVLNDLLTNLERISDHCSNIAVSVIEEHSGESDRHAYLHHMREGSAFSQALTRDIEAYPLPPVSSPPAEQP